MAKDKSDGATLIDQLYQEIGQEAVDVAGDDWAGKLLVYAEVDDDLLAADGTVKVWTFQGGVPQWRA